MLTLGIDTATGWGCLGLVKDGEILADLGWQVGRNQAEQLLPVLDGMMARAGLAPADLELIAVGCGPGSYTGIRIGLAVGEALAFAIDRPLVGVDTLAVLAGNARDFPGYVCPAIKARRGEVYAGIYRDGAVVMPPAPITPAELAAQTAGLDGSVLVLGNGASMIRAAESGREFALCYGRPEQSLPRGAVVAMTGAADPSRPARPAYLRRTEAEVLFGGGDKACRPCGP